MFRGWNRHTGTFQDDKGQLSGDFETFYENFILSFVIWSYIKSLEASASTEIHLNKNTCCHALKKINVQFVSLFPSTSCLHLVELFSNIFYQLQLQVKSAKSSRVERIFFTDDRRRNSLTDKKWKLRVFYLVLPTRVASFTLNEPSWQYLLLYLYTLHHLKYLS